MLQYVIITDYEPEDGIMKKARAQVAALNALGIPSELIIVTQDVEKKEEFDNVTLLYVGKCEDQKIFSRLKRAKRIRNLVRDIILSLKSDDIFYYRGLQNQLSYYPLTFFRPFRKCRIISEHQSVEINESLLYHSYLSAFIDLLSGNIIIGQSDGIIGVTDEITAFWTKRLFYRKIPRATIPNGFNVHSVEVRNPPRVDNNNIHILFVGNISRWHGLDRMIRGIADYRGPVHIHFHIVGDGDELENLRQLKKSVAPAADIHFHGFLSGHPLDAMFDTCHIAIGSLGIHRNRMKEAASLKVREYCSRGIPFILSNKDPDFSDNFEYCLHIEPTDTPVNVEEIISFTQKVFQNTDHSKIMRKYAEEYVDWHVKGAQLKEFINKNFSSHAR
jgi:glycosyltransferase involved in cell wall biosynthesis